MSEINESKEIFEAKVVERENPEDGVVGFQKDMRREYFLSELQEKGLELEEEIQEVSLSSQLRHSTLIKNIHRIRTSCLLDQGNQNW